jgi:hypothetical protein
MIAEATALSRDATEKADREARAASSRARHLGRRSKKFIPIVAEAAPENSRAACAAALRASVRAYDAAGCAEKAADVAAVAATHAESSGAPFSTNATNAARAAAANTFAVAAAVRMVSTGGQSAALAAIYAGAANVSPRSYARSLKPRIQRINARIAIQIFDGVYDDVYESDASSITESELAESESYNDRVFFS